MFFQINLLFYDAKFIITEMNVAIGISKKNYIWKNPGYHGRVSSIFK
jgi:hypothetical protein